MNWKTRDGQGWHTLPARHTSISIICTINSALGGKRWTTNTADRKTRGPVEAVKQPTGREVDATAVQQDESTLLMYEVRNQQQ